MRSKFAGDKTAGTSDKINPRRLMNGVIKDHLSVAVVDELAPKKLLTMEKSKSLETKLTMVIMDYILMSEEEKKIPVFDS